MVLDNLRVTSLTVLNRRRDDAEFTSPNNDDDCSAMGKLNFRLFSTTGKRSMDLVDNAGVSGLDFGNDDGPIEFG